jgi:CDP-4-dehydro-6-deoxyglucose reductase/terephthalate 1,2-dioxygenase reductase component
VCSGDITLIWGAREPGGLHLCSAIERWQKHWLGLRFVAALSYVLVDAASDVFAGRVNEALLAKCADLTGRVLHCCGSSLMVTAVRAATTVRGLASEYFHADVFV